ncbi:hypothetical protein FRB98_003272 [Tulasnella sp. 332]|nr:hypothetical protein FRB98_003272 [Tulasnella sp. 332]
MSHHQHHEPSSPSTYGGQQEQAIFYDIPPPTYASYTQSSSFPTLEYIPPTTEEVWVTPSHHPQHTFSPQSITSPIAHWPSNSDGTHDLPSWHVPQNDIQDASASTFATPIPFDPVSVVTPGRISRDADPAYHSQAHPSFLIQEQQHHAPRPQLHVDISNNAYQQQQQLHQFNQQHQTPISRRSYEERHQLAPALLARLRQTEAISTITSGYPLVGGASPPASASTVPHADSIGQVMTNGMNGQQHQQAPPSVHRSYSYPAPPHHQIGQRHLETQTSVYDGGYQQHQPFPQHQNYAPQDAQQNLQHNYHGSSSGPTTTLQSRSSYTGSLPDSQAPEILPPSTHHHHQYHQQYTNPTHTSIAPQLVGDEPPAPWPSSASVSTASMGRCSIGHSSGNGGGANHIAAPIARSATMPDLFHCTPPNHATHLHHRHQSQPFASPHEQCRDQNLPQSQTFISPQHMPDIMYHFPPPLPPPPQEAPQVLCQQHPSSSSNQASSITSPSDATMMMHLSTPATATFQNGDNTLWMGQDNKNLVMISPSCGPRSHPVQLQPQHQQYDSTDEQTWSSSANDDFPAPSSSSPQTQVIQQQQHLQTIELDGALSDSSTSGSGNEHTVKSEPGTSGAASGASGANSKKSEKKPFLACKFCRGRKIQCGPGPKLPPEIECKLPPGPRTCNQCHKRGLVCRFPEASRRGLRGGKPSRLVVYGPDNRFRIVDADDIDAANGHPIYDEDFDGVGGGGEMDGPSPPTSADGWDTMSPPPQDDKDKKGKGKKKERKGGSRPWSPMRFVPAVDTEILKELTARGVLLPVITTKGSV